LRRARTVYLDFAATSALRPPEVAAAMVRYMEECGATPGRGGHRLAVDAGRIALRCRQAIARLLAVPGDPGRIAFMHNATHALNTALWGTVRRGDTIVLTDYDHNAVRRPAAALVAQRGVTVRYVRGAPDGSLDEAALHAAVDGARLVSINAASNVLGTCPDVRRLAAIARAAGALVLVDAAQVAGHAPFDAGECGADLLALTGHKGLLGPQGIGALWVAPGIDIEPLLTGGTGGDSASDQMPAALPDRLEAGTLNGPAIAGLLAGIEWLERRGVAAVANHALHARDRLHAGLAALDGIRVLSPRAESCVPIVTFTANRVDAATLASRLDREHGVLCRHGLHCAPGAHRLLGTLQTGAVRFSAGWCTTDEDVERAIAAVAGIVGA
jgi:cysteine desulfurase / selenocysteine lyase